LNELQQKVLERIDRDELIELALALGNIPSPAGEEAEIGNFIHDWLARNEYSPRRIGFVPERSCMAGVLPGAGEGMSLAFNSHMDTAKQVDDVARQLPGSGGRGAWVEGKHIMGAGIVNDKGPMAAWMIAANAIRKAGVKLRGDLVLTMVPGEIDQEPVDEFTSPRYLSKEVGARYLITRGVVADCALVAEGTHFKVTWAGAGKACFKVTVLGTPLYVPFLPARGELTQSPNAIVKTAAVIAGLEDWARAYERDGVVDTPGGRFIPKANIGALRAGSPFHISVSSAACHLYIDVRLAPGADPLAIRAALRGVLAKCGVEGTVELYTFRKAQVADDRIAPLVAAIGESHSALGHEPPPLADPIYTSMWRDHIAFIEAGIPALTYGPGAATAAGTKLGMLLDDLERAARSYALVALNMCMRKKN
jgi:acetylornithine deacetylase/succinyl-diaminopimelate desuccinylase-like protein